jgi:AAA domain
LPVWAEPAPPEQWTDVEAPLGTLDLFNPPPDVRRWRYWERCDPRGAWDFERLQEDWDRQLREIHAGKRAHLDTWNQLTYDLAVSVACGRPWLDHFACPTPGPVLVFLGEGGERATVRRIETIATAKGVDSNHLADQQAGWALLVVTHWSKTGDGRGADRISGAGPAAWARVICSIAVHYRSSDPMGPASSCWGPS